MSEKNAWDYCLNIKDILNDFGKKVEKDYALMKQGLVPDEKVKVTLAEMEILIKEEYEKMREKCEKEREENEDRHEIQKRDMRNLYEKLEINSQMRMAWIRRKLPWYLVKFCKVQSYEISLRDTDIFIGVSFGKSVVSNCYVKVIPQDIGW